MKELLYKSGIIIHVIAGVLALVTGLIAMTARKKGGKLHNINGLIFYWAMAVIFVTTALFFVLYPGQLKYHFFLMIGIVSFYPTYSGRRLLTMKKKINPNSADHLASWLVLISGGVMISYGIWLQLFAPNTLSVLFFVFGAFSMLQGYNDRKVFGGKKEVAQMHWFYAHAAKMIGAYSAAVTAFCVNIVPRYLPENTGTLALIFLWVSPGVIFGIISARLVRKYKARFQMKA